MKLLSIIGEDTSQIIPVLYAFKDKFKHHILLCDSSSRLQAEQLVKGMNSFSIETNLSWEIDIQIVDENNLNNVLPNVQEKTGEFRDCWLNVTDAYPMLTLLMGKTVQESGGQVISYNNFTNTLHFIDHKQNITCELLLPKMDLESYMTLLDYRIVDQKRKSDLLANKKNIMSLYENQSLYRKVRQALLEQHFGQKSNFDIGGSEDILKRLHSMGIIDQRKRLIPQKQKVLQGDMFEEYIFWLCAVLDPDDIAMGVKIDFDDRENEPRAHYRVHNEFDILLMHNNRIFTVECKFSTRLKGLEFIYKFDTVIDYFGKTSKAIVVNISNNSKEHYIDMNSSSSFRHSTLRRARLSGIHVYHEEKVNVAKFQSLVQSFFHIGVEDEDR